MTSLGMTCNGVTVNKDTSEHFYEQYDRVYIYLLASSLPIVLISSLIIKLINSMSNIIGEPVLLILYLSTHNRINYSKVHVGKKVDKWHFESVNVRSVGHEFNRYRKRLVECSQ